MPQSILDVLTQKNPELDASSVPSGQNTFSEDWVPVVGWRPWLDFTYQNLMSIYHQVLSTDWRHPPSIDMASGFDRQVRDEQSMDYVLAKYIWPHVNGALAKSTSVLAGRDEVLYLAPGSWCHGSGPPDWGLVSNHRLTDGKFWNLLPGDTKLSAKWQPDMLRSEDDNERDQWSLPLAQVSTYAANSNCRYGFIITDQVLVALRFAKEPIGDGIASTRPTRAPDPRLHQRVASGGTDVSSLLDSMSLDSFGAQSYHDSEHAHAEFLPPEYAVIPWAAHGKGRLSVKLSVFCLSLMAAVHGDISDDYPPLDSWRQEGRHKFIHNTSGFLMKKLPHKATLYNREESDQHGAAVAGPSGQQSSNQQRGDQSAEHNPTSDDPDSAHHAYPEDQLQADRLVQGASSSSQPESGRRYYVQADWEVDDQIGFKHPLSGQQISTSSNDWVEGTVDYEGKETACWIYETHQCTIFTWEFGDRRARKGKKRK